MASNTSSRIEMLFCFLLYLNEIQTIEIFGGKQNNLRSKIKSLKKITSNLEGSVKTLETDTNTRINALETDVNSKLEELEGDIGNLKSNVRDILIRIDGDKEVNATDTTAYGQSTMKDCPPLQLANAVVRPAVAVAHGSTVVVECSSPFTLVGNPKPVCNDGGFTDAPSCDNLDIFDITEMRVDRQRRINITNTDDNEIWNKGWISGSLFLPDGRLILSDTDDYKIKLFSRDFELEDTLSYRDGFITTWAIGIVNDTTVVVTKPFHNEIDFLQYIPRLQRVRTVSVAKCYGVDVLKDTIYLSCFDGRIRRYDRNGNFKNVMQLILFQGPYWISANPATETLCVADWNARLVKCFTSDGLVTFTYSSPTLSRPQAVLSDDRGNLIIADWRNDNVQVIKKSDKSRIDLLTSEDGILSPYSLAYRRSDKTLTVGQQWTRWFHIVQLNFD